MVPIHFTNPVLFPLINILLLLWLKAVEPLRLDHHYKHYYLQPQYIV